MILGREMMLDAGSPKSRHNLQILQRQRSLRGLGRPSHEQEDRFERLIALLRGLDAGDLELFNEILPRLVEWKGGK